VELTDGAAEVGVLRLNGALSAWVELAWRGVAFDAHEISFDSERVVFELDADVVRAALGAFAVRVVDAGSSAPPRSTRVRVRRRVSAPADVRTRDVALDMNGFALVGGLLAGEYDVDVDAEGRRTVSRRLRVEAGAQPESLEIELERDAPWSVRVHARDGTSRRWNVVVAPYEPGVRLDVALAQRRAYGTNDDGLATLGRPGSRVVVQAVPANFVNPDKSFDSRGSAAIVVDPDQFPSGLDLEVVRVVDVEIECSKDAAHASQIVVATPEDVWVAVGLYGRLTTQLAPGRYRARALTASGETLAEVEFEVTSRSDALKVVLR